MKIKAKLAVGTTTLFLLILALGIIGTLFTNRLAKDSGEIIRDNYTSLGYSRKMQKALNRIQSNARVKSTDHGNADLVIKSDLIIFEKNLEFQKKNFSEAGEKELIEELEQSFKNYKQALAEHLSDSNELELKYSDLNEKLGGVFNINMAAMKAKSSKVKDLADQATLYMSILGGIAILMAFLLVFNFPGYIADPLIEITERIKEIANKNYDQRLFYRTKDELGELAGAFNVMAERLAEYDQLNLEEVKTEKGRIESIVKNLNEGIILLDREQKIKIINPIAASLLKVNVHDVIESYAPDIAVKNDLFRELIKDINAVTNENSSLKISVRGEENYFKKEVFKVYKDSSDELSGYIISIRNITEFKNQDLARTNFIAVVSHELKTPIASINLSIKLLQDTRIGSLNEEQKGLIDSVKEETTRLSRITGELLDISQVETGNIKLHVEEVDPQDIIKFSVDVLKPQLKDKKIHLTTSILENLPSVKADLEKTVWVMTNLLANAVRYTPEGGAVKVQLIHSFNELYFSVEDSGPGIEIANREKIFKRFVQVDGNKQREGVGLGLAISKEFIEKQRGKIWVESKVGVGSKFIFTLPVV